MSSIITICLIAFLSHQKYLPRGSTPAGSRRVEEAWKESIGRTMPWTRRQHVGMRKMSSGQSGWLLTGRSSATRHIHVIMACDKHKNFPSVITCLKPNHTVYKIELQKDIITLNSHTEFFLCTYTLFLK